MNNRICQKALFQAPYIFPETEVTTEEPTTSTDATTTTTEEATETSTEDLPDMTTTDEATETTTEDLPDTTTEVDDETTTVGLTAFFEEFGELSLGDLPDPDISFLGDEKPGDSGGDQQVNSPPPEGSMTTCEGGDGWFPEGTKCYKIVEVRMNWDAAMKVHT